jgi:hypothetical protein
MARNINLLVTIVCEEGREDGIEDAVTACLNTLDHVESYIFDTEDRDWEEEEEAEEERAAQEERRIQSALDVLNELEIQRKKQDN